jgi:hypothetical protein
VPIINQKHFLVFKLGDKTGSVLLFLIRFDNFKNGAASGRHPSASSDCPEALQALWPRSKRDEF